MSTKSRSLRVIFLISFFGCLIGTVLNKVFIFILPKDTIISRFFIDSSTIIKLPDNFIKEGIPIEYIVSKDINIGKSVEFYDYKSIAIYNKGKRFFFGLKICKW